MQGVLGFPNGLAGKESACNGGDTGDLGLSLDREDLLEKEMATHSGTLAWKIPWMEEPGKSWTRLNDFFLCHHLESH